MLRYKTETRPGLVALYDIRPGNGAGQFLQPRSHRATVSWATSGDCRTDQQYNEITIPRQKQTEPGALFTKGQKRWSVIRWSYNGYATSHCYSRNISYIRSS